MILLYLLCFLQATFHLRVSFALQLGAKSFHDLVNNCRGGPPWPPVRVDMERAATEGRPYSCSREAQTSGLLSTFAFLSRFFFVALAFPTAEGLNAALEFGSVAVKVVGAVVAIRVAHVVEIV